MIPNPYIVEWREHVPWILDSQVEQDLIISRALIEIYRHENLSKQLAFRGGTALYKLYLLPPARYSEDLDFVQVNAEPIGPTIDNLRQCLDPWLGKPKRSRSEGGVTILYSFQPEGNPLNKMHLKIEINSREHFSLFGFEKRSFRTSSSWFAGEVTIQTYGLEELLGTKLRALYQRRKGRDLFDLWLGLTAGKANPKNVLQAFVEYTSRECTKISRKEFLLNLERKAQIPEFMSDMRMILAPEFNYDPQIALGLVADKLISLLP